MLGKGIPNITTEQQTGTNTRWGAGGDLREEKSTTSSPSATKGVNNSALPKTAVAESGGHSSDSPASALRREHSSHGQDATAEKEYGEQTESGVDKRIHLLQRARRQMTHAGAMAATACIQATAALEAHDGQPTSAER